MEKQNAIAVGLLFKKFLFTFKDENGFPKYRYWFFNERLKKKRFFKIFLNDLEKFSTNLFFYVCNFPSTCVEFFQICLNDLTLFSQYKFQTSRVSKIPPKVFLVPKTQGQTFEGNHLQEKNHLIELVVKISSVGDKKIHISPNFFRSNTDYLTNLYYEEIVNQIEIKNTDKRLDLSNFKTFDSLKNNVFYLEYQFLEAFLIDSSNFLLSPPSVIKIFCEDNLGENLREGELVVILGQYFNNLGRMSQVKSIGRSMSLENPIFSIFGYKKKAEFSLGLLKKEGCNEGKILLNLALERKLIDWFSLCIFPNSKQWKNLGKAILCQLFFFSQKEKIQKQQGSENLNVLVLGGQEELPEKLRQFFSFMSTSSNLDLFKSNNRIGSRNLESFTGIFPHYRSTSDFKILGESRIILTEDLFNLKFKYTQKGLKNFFHEENRLSEFLEFRKNCLISFIQIKKKYWENRKYSFIEKLENSSFFTSFDLIFEKPSRVWEEHEKDKIKFLINSKMKVRQAPQKPWMDLGGINLEIFRNFTNYVIKNFNPLFSKKASVILQTSYLLFRNEIETSLNSKRNNYKEKSLRLVDSVVKISQVYCKIRLSNVIEHYDVTSALGLIVMGNS